MAMFPTVIYDQTSVANTAITTGDLDMREIDVLNIEVLPSGAAAASTITLYDVGLSTSAAIASFATPATAAVKTCGWGSDASPAASGEYVGGRPGALPPIVRVSVGALGAGITARLRIPARRP